MKNKEIKKTTAFNKNSIARKRSGKIYEDSENPRASSTNKRTKNGQEPRKVFADIKNLTVPGRADIVTKVPVAEPTVIASDEKLLRDTSSKENESNRIPQWPPIELLTYDKKEKIREQKQTLFCVTQYSDDVYSYLLNLEKKLKIEKHHLLGQELNGRMRAILIDYIADVTNNMDLHQETLQLTTYVVDKFMSIDKKTTKGTAQLVALASLLIAAKYEETENIDINDLIATCSNDCSGNDVKIMECTILQSIDYSLGKPLAIHFIRRLSKASGASPMEHCYAKFFADASLLSYQLCSVTPSIIASASVFLALCISKGKIEERYWSTTLQKTSSYELTDFYHIVPHIAEAVVGMETNQLLAIRIKYSSSQLFCVSLMPGCRPETGIINHFCLA